MQAASQRTHEPRNHERMPFRDLRSRRELFGGEGGDVIAKPFPFREDIFRGAAYLTEMTLPSVISNNCAGKTLKTDRGVPAAAQIFST